MLLFVPTPQKKKGPKSFADELAARIKGEAPVKQDEERSCKLTLSFDKHLWDTGGLEAVGQESLCNRSFTDLLFEYVLCENPMKGIKDTILWSEKLFDHNL